MYHIVGVFIGEGPPVPIPNTEVKLTYADNTYLATGREDRSTPTQRETTIKGSSFFLFPAGRSEDRLFSCATPLGAGFPMPKGSCQRS